MPYFAIIAVCSTLDVVELQESQTQLLFYAGTMSQYNQLKTHKNKAVASPFGKAAALSILLFRFFIWAVENSHYFLNIKITISRVCRPHHSARICPSK